MSTLSMQRRLSAGVVPSARYTIISTLRRDSRISGPRLLGLLCLLSLLGLPTLPRGSVRLSRPRRLSRPSRRLFGGHRYGAPELHLIPWPPHCCNCAASPSVSPVCWRSTASTLP